MCQICLDNYNKLNPEIEKAMMEATPEFTALLDKVISMMPEETSMSHQNLNNDMTTVDQEEFIQSLPENEREEARNTAKHVQRVIAATWLTYFFMQRWAINDEGNYSSQLTAQIIAPDAMQAGHWCKVAARQGKH